MSMVDSQDEIKGKSLVELAQELEAKIREAARDGKPLHEVEKKTFERLLQIGHAAFELFLGLQGDGDLGETVDTPDGQLQRSEELVDRPLRTVFGEHTIRAYVYAAGSHQAIQLRPIDARLALPPGRCSYLFEEFSQYFCVDQAFGQASQGLATVLGQEVSVDTLERLNRRMGQQAEEFLDELPPPPAEEEGELLVFTADGKGVPLVKADTQRVAAFDEAPRRPGNRRMATLAAVYTIDPYVRTPEQIVAALFRDEEAERPKGRPQPRFKQITARFTRTCVDPDGEPWESNGTAEAFGWAAERIAARRRAGQKVLRLMDGQESLWDTADVCLDLPPEDLVDILDILHVSGYVWRAAKVFQSQRDQQEAFARDRLLRILRGQVGNVIAGLRQLATRRRLKGKRREEIATVCGYFQKHAHRMRYHEYLAAGYPIATGVIEGACRHLVKDRMERSGMRWRLAGAQPMLHVRAVYQSSYWDEFHQERIAREQCLIHPHRTQLRNYHPLALVC